MTTQQTSPLPLRARPTETHEHGWIVDSRHSTSEGVVLYVECAVCGTRRVDLQLWPLQPPLAVSRET